MHGLRAMLGRRGLQQTSSARQWGEHRRVLQGRRMHWRMTRPHKQPAKMLERQMTQRRDGGNGGGRHWNGETRVGAGAVAFGRGKKPKRGACYRDLCHLENRGSGGLVLKRGGEARRRRRRHREDEGMRGDFIKPNRSIEKTQPIVET